jgi:hypothetical protein
LSIQVPRRRRIKLVPDTFFAGGRRKTLELTKPSTPHEAEQKAELKNFSPASPGFTFC